MRCHTFCEEADSSGLILKIDSKYSSNSSTGCVLEVHFEYPKELRELQNDYPLASVEPKKEMLSE